MAGCPPPMLGNHRRDEQRAFTRFGPFTRTARQPRWAFVDTADMPEPRRCRCGRARRCMRPVPPHDGFVGGDDGVLDESARTGRASLLLSARSRGVESARFRNEATSSVASALDGADFIRMRCHRHRLSPAIAPIPASASSRLFWRNNGTLLTAGVRRLVSRDDARTRLLRLP